MVYVWSLILIGDNKRKYSSQQPWIHGTCLMWALHVWSCVTDFSSLMALLGYLVTCKIRAHSPSPDGRYQIICNFVRTCYEPLDYANLIFDRCVATRLCQQTRFIVPVECPGANRVPIVPEDSGSHRHHDRMLHILVWPGLVSLIGYLLKTNVTGSKSILSGVINIQGSFYYWAENFSCRLTIFSIGLIFLPPQLLIKLLWFVKWHSKIIKLFASICHDQKYI